MTKLKFLSFMLLFLAASLSFSSCSDDDGNKIEITKEMVVGTWDVTQAIVNGESINISDGMIQIILRDDNSYTVWFYDNRYIGTYRISGNTIIGTTLDPIVERFEFQDLTGKIATINYSNSDGDKYIFKAVKSN